MTSILQSCTRVAFHCKYLLHFCRNFTQFVFMASSFHYPTQLFKFTHVVLCMIYGHLSNHLVSVATRGDSVGILQQSSSCSRSSAVHSTDHPADHIHMSEKLRASLICCPTSTVFSFETSRSLYKGTASL